MTTTAQASDTYFPARPSTDGTVRDLDHAHVFHSWSAQDEINPLPVASGSGASFTDYEGREFLDFGSPSSTSTSATATRGSSRRSRTRPTFCRPSPPASPMTPAPSSPR